MSRHTFVYSHSREDFDHFAILGEKEGRLGKAVARLALPRDDVSREDTLRMVCFLLDALAVRDAEALGPADWVDIGTDDEEEDLYAEAYDEGFRDGSAAAFEMLGDEVDEDDEDELSPEDDYFGPYSH